MQTWQPAFPLAPYVETWQPTFPLAPYVETWQPAFPLAPYRMDPIAYAELLKESGNQVFRNGNFSLAIRKYDEAIQVLLHLFQWG